MAHHVGRGQILPIPGGSSETHRRFAGSGCFVCAPSRPVQPTPPRSTAGSPTPCAAPSTPAAGAACVKKCIEGGMQPVFVDESKKQVWKIDNPDAVKGLLRRPRHHLGHRRHEHQDRPHRFDRRGKVGSSRHGRPASGLASRTNSVTVVSSQSLPALLHSGAAGASFDVFERILSWQEQFGTAR